MKPAVVSEAVRKLRLAEKAERLKKIAKRAIAMKRRQRMFDLASAATEGGFGAGDVNADSESELAEFDEAP